MGNAVREKFRLVVLTTGFAPVKGGIPTYTWEICKGLAVRGADVTVIAVDADQAVAFDRCTAAQRGMRVLRARRRYGLRELSMLILGIYACLKYRPDVVLATIWLPCGILALVLKALLRVPYVMTVHGYEVFRGTRTPRDRIRSATMWAMRLSANNASKILCVSRFTREAAIRAGVDAAKTEYVPNGVDTSRFCRGPIDAGLRQRFGVPRGRMLLTVGELVDYKGQDRVIEALPRVLAIHPDVVYVVIGRGGFLGELQRLVARLEVESRVFFLGGVSDDDLLNWYREASLYVMVSRVNRETGDVEGFGIAFVEAGACGTPCIGGDSGGVPDAVIHGLTGELVDPLDAKKVADAIIRLLNHPELMERYGRNAVVRARTEVDWRLIAERVDGVLCAAAQCDQSVVIQR